MRLIAEPRKKVRLSAYWLLRLFVINPKPTPAIGLCVARNRAKLIRALRRLPMKNAEESMAAEWTEVISHLESLSDS
jgi:hypothetical protein